MIFVLDDDKERILRFKKELGEDIVVATSYSEAMSKIDKLFESGKVLDYVFLDHDLGEADEKNGFDFANQLVHYPIGSPTVFVHSMNPVGAKNMRNVLRTEFLTHIIPYNRLWDILTIQRDDYYE